MKIINLDIYEDSKQPYTITPRCKQGCIIWVLYSILFPETKRENKNHDKKIHQCQKERRSYNYWTKVKQVFEIVIDFNMCITMDSKTQFSDSFAFKISFKKKEYQ